MTELTAIRPEFLQLTDAQLQALWPTLILTATSVLGIVFAIIPALKPRWGVPIVSMLGILAAAVALCPAIGSDPVLLFGQMMVADDFTAFFGLLFMAAAFFTILASLRYLDREGLPHPEYCLLVVFSLIGMYLMASSLDLIVIFVALELMSLAVYVLVGFRRNDRRSNEAAVKYFILGSAASAILLYGSALLYGSTGSFNLKDILAAANAGAPSAIYWVGAWLVIAGFLFKVAVAPFHMWMPDVYEGAPVPVTGFMTTGLKAAAFATFLRVFVSLDFGDLAGAHTILWVCAVLTMVVGNVIALTQTNLKRMLAYSSIAHSGYLLVGMIAGAHSEQGYAPVLVYLVAYAAMNLGAFVLLTMISTRHDGGLNLRDLSGFAQKNPWHAFTLAVFMFSMAGIPPTAGFAAKYLLFYGAVQAGEIPLVVISVLCSAISVYYYLRVLVFMYMREPEGVSHSPGWSRYSRASGLAAAVMVLVTLQVGMLPSRVIEAARLAIQDLTP